MFEVDLKIAKLTSASTLWVIHKVLMLAQFHELIKNDILNIFIIAKLYLLSPKASWII